MKLYSTLLLAAICATSQASIGSKIKHTGGKVGKVVHHQVIKHKGDIVKVSVKVVEKGLENIVPGGEVIDQVVT